MKKIKVLISLSSFILLMVALTSNIQAESLEGKKKLYETSGGEYCCKDTSDKECEAADCGTGPIMQ